MRKKRRRMPKQGVTAERSSAAPLSGAVRSAGASCAFSGAPRGGAGQPNSPVGRDDFRCQAESTRRKRRGIQVQVMPSSPWHDLRIPRRAALRSQTIQRVRRCGRTSVFSQQHRKNVVRGRITHVWDGRIQLRVKRAKSRNATRVNGTLICLPINEQVRRGKS
jgi:hypothetical protein